MKNKIIYNNYGFAVATISLPTTTVTIEIRRRYVSCK